MTFIPWTAALKLGVPIIDEQHRVLVDLINALHAAISDAAGARDAIADILEGEARRDKSLDVSAINQAICFFSQRKRITETART